MRCLIVDDDERWRSALGEELADLGFDCTFAADDAEAIRHLKQAEKWDQAIDLITLDRHLEGMGAKAGTRVLSFLKNYGPLKRWQTVCLVISGTSTDIDVRDYFKQYPVDDFISKTDPDIWEKMKTLVAGLSNTATSALNAPVDDIVGTSGQQPDQKVLRELLVAHFNEGELRTLCQDLNVDYDALGGDGKVDKARELVNYLNRRDRLPELLRAGQASRPNAAWLQA